MIARGTGYIRGAKEPAAHRLHAHFRYLEREAATVAATNGTDADMAARERQHLFSATQDQVSRQEAMKLILERATQARCRFHKLVLSPATNEPVPDWKAWTRAVMADLQQHLGIELTWTAIKHINTEHPHIHVVLAGAGASTQTGGASAVRLHLTEYELLRASGQAQSDWSWHQRLARLAAQGQEAEARDPLGALLPGELRVGTYGALEKAGSRSDAITPHHMPSAEFMEKHGVKYDECVSINMEHPESWPGGRHRLTRTYGWRNVELVHGNGAPETPRQALAHDVRDVRRIYRSQGHEITQPLREVIQKNKTLYPAIFKKEGKQ